MKPGWRVRRLSDGSGVVARRLGRAFVPQDADGETRLIASGIRIGAGLMLGNGLLTLAHQSPVWLVGGTCGWCWAAWRAGAGPTEPTTAEEADDEPETDDDGEWIQDAPAPETLWSIIRHTAGLTKQGTAAHLQAVLEEGQRRDPAEFVDWTVSDLAAELAAHGVPVVDGKKLTIDGRDYNRKAVLLDDLPTLAMSAAAGPAQMAS